MTIDEVQERVDEIRDSVGDYEIAHGMADKLYIDVLDAISHSAYNAADLATVALQVEKIDFPRYTA